MPQVNSSRLIPKIVSVIKDQLGELPDNEPGLFQTEVIEKTFQILRAFQLNPTLSQTNTQIKKYLTGQSTLPQAFAIGHITPGDLTTFINALPSNPYPLKRIESLMGFLRNKINVTQQSTFLEFAKVVALASLPTDFVVYDENTGNFGTSSESKISTIVSEYMKRLSAYQDSVYYTGFPDVVSLAQYLNGASGTSPYGIGFAGFSGDPGFAEIEMRIRAQMLNLAIANGSDNPGISNFAPYAESDSSQIGENPKIRFAQTIATILSDMMTLEKRVGSRKLSYKKALVPRGTQDPVLGFVRKLGEFSNVPTLIGNTTREGLMDQAAEKFGATGLNAKLLTVMTGTLGVQHDVTQTAINRQLTASFLQLQQYLSGQAAIETKTQVLVEHFVGMQSNGSNPIIEASVTNEKTALTQAANTYAESLGEETTSLQDSLSDSIDYFPVEAVFASLASLGAEQASSYELLDLPQNVSDAIQQKLYAPYLLEQGVDSQDTSALQNIRSAYNLVFGTDLNEFLPPFNLSHPQPSTQGIAHNFTFYGRLNQAQRRRLPGYSP